ncbi:hypothetical protein ANOM_000717 [Aspergillus nomiae NRRL 13137]|uniref:Ras modification protein ERF4 n=1 Tax=Aspergillus nomiae NRRL (strain ATCC 15546 / NRRL 13137 / CBS 260.88 / M93) TaxID=1509407 RepID=A0A0L1JGY9_ASPN3|nr:uncharacterized protein ANOM_000717 [Aspergillus nomiae NRRL 13137]KNG90957.1 hypothetical protein ANOM_000717 [Aspergillus nomiae NRRL 13137]
MPGSSYYTTSYEADYTYQEEDYPSPQLTTNCGPLPLPIVIPQQRPGSRERGFIAAYAPSLEACGIDRMTFLKFLDECNTAVQGNKFLAGVQVVSFGVGFTPEMIVMGVATAVQAGAYIANKGHVRHKTNAVLDQYNQELFGPRGLFCMIMSYEPETYDTAESRSSQPLSSQLNRLGSLASRSWVRDPVSGTSQGARNLPSAVAPLMYIDDRRQHKELLSDVGPPEPTEKIKRSKKVKRALDTFNDYLDRRARAQYTAENSGDILNVPLTRGFKNRYLDPNHPATNGGLIGLLSGGVLTPDPETRRRKALRRVEEEEQRVMEQYYQQMDSIRSQNQSRWEIDRQIRQCDEQFAPRFEEFRERRQEAQGKQRNIRKNVLYLTIVNKPTERELAVAAARLNSSSGYGNGIVGVTQV